MTLADHPPPNTGKSRDPFAPRKARPLPAKTDPDVADLLGVTALDPATLPAPPAPDDGANDLLDTIVQDHLQRATSPAPAPAGPADPAAPDRSDLLQKEIAALLSDDPSAETLPPAASAPAAHEPPPDSAPEIFPRSITSRASAGHVTPEEMSILLPSSGDAATDAADVPAPVTSAPTTAAEAAAPVVPPVSAADAVAAELVADAQMHAAPAAPPEPLEEPEAAISDAENILAEELTALQKNAPARNPETRDAGDATPDTRHRPAAPTASDAATLPAAETPADAPTPAPAAELGIPQDPGPLSALTAPPVVILQPDEPDDDEAPRESLLVRARRTASEIALMAAQLADLPFSWISGLDKYLLGIVAIVFFLSGWLLVALGWWLGAR
jgi:hypothetical protein